MSAAGESGHWRVDHQRLDGVVPVKGVVSQRLQSGPGSIPLGRDPRPSASAAASRDGCDLERVQDCSNLNVGPHATPSCANIALIELRGNGVVANCHELDAAFH
jgi:hypothetical protein